jgi:hypothetical protein
MDDTKELLLDLIENARAGEHTKFEQLRFFSDYITGRITYRATGKVVDALEASADSLFKRYYKAIKQHQADVSLILVYKQLQYAADFYREEQKILKDILMDYENWLFDGNLGRFLKAFLFGEERDIWSIR